MPALTSKKFCCVCSPIEKETTCTQHFKTRLVHAGECCLQCHPSHLLVTTAHKRNSAFLPRICVKHVMLSSPICMTWSNWHQMEQRGTSCLQHWNHVGMHWKSI